MSKLRALLVLGRVSNLPTVWSNCLAGWLLGGGGAWAGLFKLCAGATLVYVGGMYLNDAFDADFDRKFRRERPVPSGAVSEVTVWACGLGWLFAGGVLLALPDWDNALLAALLVMTVLVYDAVHKHVSFAPVLMAACRFFLVLMACASGSVGVTGLGLWSATVLGAYVVGLSCLARRESAPGALPYWPLLLLAAPLVLALIVNDFEHRQAALGMCLGVSAWILWSLRHSLIEEPPNLGRTMGGLLAGIPLVDLLAVGWNSPDISSQGWNGTELVVVFVALFFSAKLAQRVVPAT
ncbi:MAG: UbiA family prenyltransferase [Verrucomicrobia bacterium]|nr:UbiA family prenyltransferase [Verrucomicrobiota bacterium]